MPRPDGKLRLHVAALTSQAEVFRVTEARMAAAKERHPDLGRRLEVDWSWDLDRFEAGLRDAEILIGWRFERHDLAARAPALRWIQLTGAGSEHLQPLDWLPPGVALTNNSGAHGPKAGEFAGTAVLMLNHGIPTLSTSQRERRWQPNFTTTIAGKTVLVIGLGAMGGAVARWLKQKLGVRVLGVRRSGRPHRHADRVVATADLDAVLPEADFVVVTVPLTKETENLLDRERLGRLKPGAGLVNMGRARVVDYAALAELLESGHLSGAILDVFDPEPLPAASPLWTAPNLMVIPHCSSDDDAHYIARTLDIFFDNLGRYLAGRPLKNRISTRRQY